MPYSKHNNRWERWAIAFIAIGFIIVFVYIGIIVLKGQLKLNATINFSEVGAFGDFIGGLVGSLWAVAGFFLFYQALKNQRVEFQQTINEQKEQSEIFQLQQRESTLTTLIHNHKENMKHMPSDGKESGFVVFEKLIGSALNKVAKYCEIQRSRKIGFKHHLENNTFWTEDLNRNEVEYFYSSVTTIIKYISHNLHDKEEYHLLFRNSLSLVEQYLFSILIEFEIREYLSYFKKYDTEELLIKGRKYYSLLPIKISHNEINSELINREIYPSLQFTWENMLNEITIGYEFLSIKDIPLNVRNKSSIKTKLSNLVVSVSEDRTSYTIYSYDLMESIEIKEDKLINGIMPQAKELASNNLQLKNELQKRQYTNLTIRLTFMVNNFASSIYIAVLQDGDNSRTTLSII